jgi:hypothetical protein
MHINTNTVLIEAGSFDDYGGWILDTQFIHSMGSSYLNAHGLGRPVAPATTTFMLPETGTWHVWVRTKNWVPGPWDAPGQFKLAVNGKALDKRFGTDCDDWGWEPGGAVVVKDHNVNLSLIDLTGFNGRCDAILFTQDESWMPDNSSEPMCPWRMKYGNVEDVPDASYDLVVVGGGIAGCSAAVAGARAGLKVALVHDRSMLGGNGSSEVTVGWNGGFPPGRFPDIGDIVREVAPELIGNTLEAEPFRIAEQTRRAVIESEPNIDLFLNHYVYGVDAENNHISAVWAKNVRGRQRQRLNARVFVDASGHGIVGLKAGADHKMEPGKRMGMTNRWLWKFTDHVVHFPETPWALQLTEKAFPYPGDGGYINEEGKPARIQHDHPIFHAPAKKGGTGQWFWESGFDKHPLNDLESIRDHNLRAAFGAFNAMKNHGAYASLDPSGRSHATADLYWMACIGGPRETLQLLGDVVVTKEDVWEGRAFPDGCVPATWGIDLHLPLPLWARETPDNPFISRAHFDGYVDDTTGKWAESPRPGLIGEMRDRYDRTKGYLFPYRAFYSRNINNLFMAGRDISCSHEALGTVRVQNTLGMIGVVVGRAASLVCQYDTTPKALYEDHWKELSELLDKPGSYRVASIS